MTGPSRARQFLVFAIAALLVAGCSRDSGVDSPQQEQPAARQEQPAVEETKPAPHDLVALLASESRSESDRARDAARKPAAVLEFLGIGPGMSVVDVIGSGGYYTEVLSLAVGPDGHVAALNPARVFELRDGAMGRELEARMADNRLPNVTRMDKEFAELTADDGPFDAAITALNLHDVYNRNGEEAAVGVLAAVAQLLKPGGVFGVIDHNGLAGNDNTALHRMQLTDAIRVAEAAGFIVEASSGALHVHSDDLSGNVFAEGYRGTTHRFLLRLRKPGE